MIDGEVYNEDYFLRGKATGLSLYEDYRWMPELTVPMVCAMISRLGVDWDAKILDFGCARGYVVKALRDMGYNAFGVDLSQWAVDNADPDVQRFLTRGAGPSHDAVYDWVLAKDVLEHVVHLDDTIKSLMCAAEVGVFAVVPLSAVDGEPYVVADYEKDVTHVHRLTLATWAAKFMRPGWSVEATYRVRGVKDNYWRPRWEMGNGFVTARREK